MNKTIEISDYELHTRIEKNYRRLCEPYYQIDQVFSPKDYDWPGDKEGHSLLAFISHYKISGRKIPCMDLMIAQMEEKSGYRFYFGPSVSDVLYEQQLSGHNWLLRALCEYHQVFHSEFALKAAQALVENLYLPTLGQYKTYPVIRNITGGGVDGASTEVIGRWKLSSDIGCAFMAVDGLSQYYGITRDPRVRLLLDEMVDAFAAIDKLRIQAQTHCSLTAARGMLRCYQITGDASFLNKGREIFDLYTAEGMSFTYQNWNWWGRPDTWTEPCAIVDSLIAALELYKITGEAGYRTCAVRIYHNGFATAQRFNGGAGTDSVVCEKEPFLYIKMYEAYFCCTMRLAEGLWYASENRQLLGAASTGMLERDSTGRYFDGDILYAEVCGNVEFSLYLDPSSIVTKDGHLLAPILKYFDIPDAISSQIKQQIIFQ